MLSSNSVPEAMGAVQHAGGDPASGNKRGDCVYAASPEPVSAAGAEISRMCSALEDASSIPNAATIITETDSDTDVSRRGGREIAHGGDGFEFMSLTHCTALCIVELLDTRSRCRLASTCRAMRTLCSSEALWTDVALIPTFVTPFAARCPHARHARILSVHNPAAYYNRPVDYMIERRGRRPRSYVLEGQKFLGAVPESCRVSLLAESCPFLRSIKIDFSLSAGEVNALASALAHLEDVRISVEDAAPAGVRAMAKKCAGTLRRFVVKLSGRKTAIGYPGNMIVQGLALSRTVTAAAATKAQLPLEELGVVAYDTFLATCNGTLKTTTAMTSSGAENKIKRPVMMPNLKVLRVEDTRTRTLIQPGPDVIRACPALTRVVSRSSWVTAELMFRSPTKIERVSRNSISPRMFLAALVRGLNSDDGGREPFLDEFFTSAPESASSVDALAAEAEKKRKASKATETLEAATTTRRAALRRLGLDCAMATGDVSSQIIRMCPALTDLRLKGPMLGNLIAASESLAALTSLDIKVDLSEISAPKVVSAFASSSAKLAHLCVRPAASLLPGFINLPMCASLRSVSLDESNYDAAVKDAELRAMLSAVAGSECRRTLERVCIRRTAAASVDSVRLLLPFVRLAYLVIETVKSVRQILDDRELAVFIASIPMLYITGGIRDVEDGQTVQVAARCHQLGIGLSVHPCSLEISRGVIQTW